MSCQMEHQEFMGFLWVWVLEQFKSYGDLQLEMMC
jgi:hypothetical protein